MKQASRVSLLEIGVFGVLVAAAALSRVYAPAPNFAAVAAVGLFAGFFFRSRAMAVGTPLTAMLITDVAAGGYDAVVMLAVYGCLLLPALAGALSRREPGLGGAGAALGGVRYGRALLLALACGLVYYLVTNLAVFFSAAEGGYARSLGGLAECYWLALPFYRNSVAADLLYGGMLFGGYGLIRSRMLAGAGGAALRTGNTANNAG